MSKHMDRDLDRLQRLLLGMAALAERAVAEAAAALRAGDRDRGREVVAGDDAIDRLEQEVQEECLKILALHQPVAIDLRRVAAVMQMATDLERIGDLAVGVAERAGAAAGVPDRLGPMAERTTGMLREAVAAFAGGDALAARRVIRQDDVVDADHVQLIDGLLADMKADPERIAPGLALFTAVRNLERIADHATNIAEGVVYLTEGATVRHRPDAVGSG